MAYTAQSIDIDKCIDELNSYFGRDNLEIVRDFEMFTHAYRVWIDGLQSSHYVLSNSAASEFYILTDAGAAYLCSLDDACIMISADCRASSAYLD